MTEFNKEEIIAKTKLEVFEMLKKSIRPEFLNRIDETIMFQPLTRENVHEIVGLQFKLIAKTLESQGIKLSASPQAIEWLSELGYDPQFGARPVKRVIQKKILNELSKQILSGKVQTNGVIEIDVIKNEFVFKNRMLEAV
jgi:ATP-dependent Clp protease ATP-binding subunit ClpB